MLSTLALDNRGLKHLESIRGDAGCTADPFKIEVVNTSVSPQIT
jgi:hypothetical protein